MKMLWKVKALWEGISPFPFLRGKGWSPMLTIGGSDARCIMTGKGKWTIGSLTAYCT
jgi:hypothetical protein